MAIQPQEDLNFERFANLISYIKVLHAKSNIFLILLTEKDNIKTPKICSYPRTSVE